MVNPLEKLSRNPVSYRFLMKNGKLVEATERILRKITKGRLGIMDLVGLPSLQVTVVGRKTGIERTTTLLYVLDGERHLVIGSNWGRPEHPAWTANLLATSKVVVQKGNERFEATPRLLAGQERHQAWDAILTAWPNYRIAQEMAGGRTFRIFEIKAVKSAP